MRERWAGAMRCAECGVRVIDTGPGRLHHEKDPKDVRCSKCAHLLLKATGWL